MSGGANPNQDILFVRLAQHYLRRAHPTPQKRFYLSQAIARTAHTKV